MLVFHKKPHTAKAYEILRYKKALTALTIRAFLIKS
jgi:hypothetical protein